MEENFLCYRCKDKGWVEEITYTGQTIDNLENGKIFYGYDSFFKTTTGLAKQISGLEGAKLFSEMSKFGNQLNNLNKHKSKMIKCGCGG